MDSSNSSAYKVGKPVSTGCIPPVSQVPLTLSGFSLNRTSPTCSASRWCACCLLQFIQKASRVGFPLPSDRTEHLWVSVDSSLLPPGDAPPSGSAGSVLTVSLVCLFCCFRSVSARQPLHPLPLQSSPGFLLHLRLEQRPTRPLGTC